jgi:tetratricopeptide (TPR) repeat protein
LISRLKEQIDMKFLTLTFPILFLTVMQARRPFPAAQDERSPMDIGFHLLYELKFEEARMQFMRWQEENPSDPLGFEAMAAGYLFEEFYYQNVLTTEFFMDDARLLGGIEGKPDEKRKRHFEAAYRKGWDLAIKQLEENPEDTNALFALSIAAGMKSDFLSILEKRQMESLSMIKKAEGYAKRLLELQPDHADAWLSIGAANYIIGCLPAYKRFFLWFRRIKGDKDLGMEQLKIAAERGRYLKPFAKIFLALAALREDRVDVARSELRDLVSAFPHNHLFREELARLETHYMDSNHGEQ